MDDGVEFHIAVRAWRERLRITQAELAEAMGVGRVRVTQIESGKQPPAPLTRIAVENTLERLEEQRADELNRGIAERRKALLG